jgi:hypothetical protein
MSDEGFDRKPYEDLLASGQPIHGVKIDLPMKVIREEGGSLSIDSPTFQLAGFDRLGIVRVHMTALAVDSLKHAFAELEKNPDMRVLEIRQPAAN